MVDFDRIGENHLRDILVNKKSKFDIFHNTLKHTNIIKTNNLFSQIKEFVIDLEAIQLNVRKFFDLISHICLNLALNIRNLNQTLDETIIFVGHHQMLVYAHNCVQRRS